MTAPSVPFCLNQSTPTLLCRQVDTMMETHAAGPLFPRHSQNHNSKSQYLVLKYQTKFKTLIFLIFKKEIYQIYKMKRKMTQTMPSKLFFFQRNVALHSRINLQTSVSLKQLLQVFFKNSLSHFIDKHINYNMNQNQNFKREIISKTAIINLTQARVCVAEEVQISFPFSSEHSNLWSQFQS